MVTRTQLLWLLLMSLAGGCLSASLAIAIITGNFEMMVYSGGYILAIVMWIFIITSKEQKPAKKRAGDQHIGGEVLPEFK